jgi:hypothetical protein
LSSVKTFFRHCPSCGRRFEIRLVGKRLENEKGFSGKEQESPMTGALNLAPIVVHQDSPILVDVKEFQYAYRCRHCGHSWTELHEVTRDDKAPAGYTGD